MQVLDGFEGEYFYDIVDGQSGRLKENGRWFGYSDSVFLAVNSLSLDFIDGEGLVQDFDLSTEITSGSVHSQGQISFSHSWLDDVASYVQGTTYFTLTRFTVKPGRCSI